MRIHVIFFFTKSKRIKHESSMAVSGQIVKNIFLKNYGISANRLGKIAGELYFLFDFSLSNAKV
jgi:hypothetical protein